MEEKSKKLVLKKDVVSNLNNKEMNQIRGGYTPVSFDTIIRPFTCLNTCGDTCGNECKPSIEDTCVPVCNPDHTCMTCY